MDIKVKGIAPYPGLRDLLMEVAGKDKRISIDVEIADLEEAVPIAKRAEEENYDIIVSRGGTASLIRKHASIPVVDIPVSGYDILRVLTLIKDSNSKLAIIGFPNICHGAATVASLLDFEVPIYSISHESQARETLEKAFREGAQMVLGDVVTVKIAQEMGHHGILITSGMESIQEMLAEVKHVYDIYKRGYEEAQFYKEIIQNLPSGALLFDKQGAILYRNPVAEKWLGKSGALPAELEFLLKEKGLHKESLLFERVQVQKNSLDLKTVPQGGNVLLSLELNANSEAAEFEVIQRLARKGSFAQILGSSPEIINAVKRAKTYAKTDRHVWISGESGTGKADFAEAIHSASHRNSGKFYRIPCQSANAEKLMVELFGTDAKLGLFQLTSNDTLYFEGIEQLSASLQQRLATELHKRGDLRIISSSRTPYKNLLKDPGFHQELLHLLGEYQLVLPPLRERAEDIGEIARVLIGKHNSIYGKHIVGMREEVLAGLMEYRWPGNLKELENVIGELLALAKGHYIGKEEWSLVWERNRFAHEGNSPGTTIDLNNTWDQIERQILETVLKEEGMNQSKVALRLGISRATIWRKLQ